MPPLLLDRYLIINAEQVCDLATGDVVPIEGLTERADARTPPIATLTEVLDHGRDGQPRALIANMRALARWKDAADRVAAEAVARGYVPIAAELYARVRPMLAEDLRERTLLILAADRDSSSAARAFVDAASWTPRPHLLLTLRVGPTTPRRGGPPASDAVQQVREARAAYAGTARPRPAPALPADVAQHLQRARRADVFVAAGRHAAAERLLRDVWAALGRRRAWPQAAFVAITLGRLLLERGRPLDAARVFGDAAASATTAGEEQDEVAARIWLAIARTDAAQLTSAESTCRALLQVTRLSEPMRDWTTAVLVRVLLWQGRVDDALALPLPPLAGGRDGFEPDGAAFVDATAVRLLLAAGRLFDAGVRVQHALAAARDASPAARAVVLTSRLRVVAAAGDLMAAESTLREIATAARAGRTPLRMLRARLIWAAALRRAGRTRDAEREWRALTRLSRAAPPLVRDAIARRHAEDRIEDATATWGPAIDRHEPSAAVLVRIAQSEEDEPDAIARLLETAARRLSATRIDVWSADAGPASIVQSVGTGLGSTVGGRVLDAGLRIGPEGVEGPPQAGVPVRLGTRLVAAIVARWPADRTPPPGSVDLLELLAIVAAPRLDALIHRARTESEAATLIPELVGASRAIGDVRQAVARAAAAPFCVLVEGESGVGKELIARAVHYLSPRRERRFCDINCAALPDELLESELFGHARGSFTGAIADRVGLFEEAHGGTLFLDEVADLSPRAQAKLLRVLQQQEVRRVGEAFARAVDVRLVAAANRDMREEATAGRFRQDLLYRLDVIRISVPALRDRREDIPVLAQHFWRAAADRVGTLASLTPAVVAALAAYPWPGNVRELQNVIAALAVAAPRRGRVSPDLLPVAITGAMPLRTTRLAEAREQFERRFVEATLARSCGNRARAARALGLSRQGLAKLMERLHLTRD